MQLLLKAKSNKTCTQTCNILNACNRISEDQSFLTRRKDVLAKQRTSPALICIFESNGCVHQNNLKTGNYTEVTNLQELW